MVCGGECGLAAAEESILDQAASSPEFRRKLIAECESKTNDFRDDRLLAVAISYAKEENYDQARPLYERYLSSHPQQTRALRGLGTIHASQKSYAAATNYLRKAWALGDVRALPTLAGVYVKSRDYAGMEGLTPDLLQHKTENPEIVNCMLAYVLDKSEKRKEPLNTRLLLEALEGLPDQDVMRRDDTALLVSEADQRLSAQAELWKTRSAILAKAIRGYVVDPQSWPKARRCAVADAYGLLQQYEKAEPIYRQVLNEKADDVDALRGLGVVLAYERRFSEAIEVFRKAWWLGDRESLMGLVSAHIGVEDFSGMRDLVPSLLDRRGEDTAFVKLLIMYALKTEPKDRDLFFKAIDGLTDDQLVREDDTVNLAVTGLTLFGDKERAERLLKLKKEQAKPKKA